jgi:hypothetical protein
MKHIVMFSGGIGSWAAAKRVAEQHGTDDLTLLFTDTLIEDEDLYRFLGEAAANVGAPLIQITEGRDPWQVFLDERFLGSTHGDPCSRILKRQMSEQWLITNCNPVDTVVYTGIDWSEEHRHRRLSQRRGEKGWRYEAPMCGPPYLTKPDMIAALKREGITPPRLYAMGFAHNNCGGFCIKAGLGHFANLLRTMPDRYAYHEAKEAELRQAVGWRNTILRDRIGGETKPLSLKRLREQIEAGGQVDLFDIGGCGCFSEEGSL